jgi:hypothetical protein
MNPKEKANELVQLFTFSCRECDNAKESALIAVDEIIKAINFDWMEVQNLESEHRYWLQVKQEIENIGGNNE